MTQQHPSKTVAPEVPPEVAKMRREVSPDQFNAFREFGKQVFAEGALDEKTKQLIAIAVAHVTQCSYCIEGHTKIALKKGATSEEIMEAIWVAAEMRAGGAYAHSAVALETIWRAEKENQID